MIVAWYFIFTVTTGQWLMGPPPTSGVPIETFYATGHTASVLGPFPTEVACEAMAMRMRAVTGIGNARTTKIDTSPCWAYQDPRKVK